VAPDWRFEVDFVLRWASANSAEAQLERLLAAGATMSSSGCLM